MWYFHNVFRFVWDFIVYFLSFHSDFRIHLVFNYYCCRFDTVFCFSFTLVFDIFIVFLVCSKFCRIVYVCFMFLVTFSRYDFSFNHVFRVHLTFQWLFIRFVKVFVYVFRVLGCILTLSQWWWWWWWWWRRRRRKLMVLWREVEIRNRRKT